MTATSSPPASASARVEAALAAIAAWQPVTNGMITVTADAARHEAAAADKAAAEGRWQGLLHGMVMTLKDNIDTAGVRTTSGSLFFKDHIPNHDAPVVSRLRRAGAVIVGKCTLHEFAFGVRSFNPVIGPARNPHDPARVPGGSSGGSGISVATGMCEGSLGTDTGGSIRIPSAFCGVTGLRPTSGRVSNRGCTPVSLSHDTIGPLAGSALDCARIFAVIAGYDAEDPSSDDRPLENFLPTLDEGIQGVRIGVPTNHYLDQCTEEVAAAYEAAIRSLEKIGARIVRIAVPGAEDMLKWGALVIYADACAFHAERLQDQSKWGAMTVERLKTGLAFSATDYARAMRAKEVWKRTLARVLTEVDILASPTIPDEPPPVDDSRSLLQTTMAVAKNTYLGAFGHLPGLSVPCGYSRNGLPFALQLEAAWWREPLLLRAGHAYQEVTDWHRRRPRLPARA